MYGTLYGIDGHLAAAQNDSHNHIKGEVHLLNDSFNYLDNFIGERYERKIVSIHTENSLISCWAYILKQI